MSGVFGSPTTNEPPAPGVYGGGWPTDPAEAHLAAIRAALPTTFYADRPLHERVLFLVDQWGKAIAELNNAQRIIDELRGVQRQRKEREAFVVQLLGGDGE